jgi:hypothetical protein
MIRIVILLIIISIAYWAGQNRVDWAQFRALFTTVASQEKTINKVNTLREQKREIEEQSLKY